MQEIAYVKVWKVHARCIFRRISGKLHVAGMYEFCHAQWRRSRNCLCQFFSQLVQELHSDTSNFYFPLTCCVAITTECILIGKHNGFVVRNALVHCIVFCINSSYHGTCQDSGSSDIINISWHENGDKKMCCYYDTVSECETPTSLAIRTIHYTAQLPVT